MSQIRQISMVLAALLLGALAPRCSPKPPDDSLGRLCAAAGDGEEHCVSVNQGPAAAWKQAAPHGELPVQMWAKRPESVTLDQLVQSRDELNYSGIAILSRSPKTTW